MDDVAPIKNACDAAAELKKDVESINAEEDEEEKSPEDILSEIKKIGVLITEVSFIKRSLFVHVDKIKRCFRASF